MNSNNKVGKIALDMSFTGLLAVVFITLKLSHLALIKKIGSLKSINVNNQKN